MDLTGIVVEYNPFHNGHLHQIKEIKKHYPHTSIAIVMSGNFTQRGTPCLLDKYTRAEMALSQGVDLVFELPTPFATSSAEFFADAAISTFEHSGIVNRLCFGSESTAGDRLLLLAKILLEEPIELSSRIKAHLKEGKSFPRARALGLMEYLKGTQLLSIENDLDFMNFLSAPNTILGIEYLKALLRHKSTIEPFIIHRQTAQYHDQTILHAIASATAIRHHMYFKDYEKISFAMPPEAFKLLKDNEYGVPLLNDYSTCFYYKIIMSVLEDLYAIWDIPKNLCHSLYHFKKEPIKDLDAIIEQSTSKTYSKASVQRAILHFLLDLKTTDMMCFKEQDYTPYIRVIACKKSARPLLSALHKKADVPVILNYKQGEALSNTTISKLIRYENSASGLYDLMYRTKTATLDYTYHPFKD